MDTVHELCPRTLVHEFDMSSRMRNVAYARFRITPLDFQ
jgi:hypothetical protein